MCELANDYVGDQQQQELLVNEEDDGTGKNEMKNFEQRPPVGLDLPVNGRATVQIPKLQLCQLEPTPQQIIEQREQYLRAEL